MSECSKFMRSAVLSHKKMVKFISQSKKFWSALPKLYCQSCQSRLFFTTAVFQMTCCFCSKFMNTRSCCMELEIDVSLILEVFLTICMHRLALIWLMLLEISRFACTTGMWILQRGALTST